MNHLLNGFLRLASTIGGLISVGIILLLLVAFLILPQIPQLGSETDLELKVPFQVYTKDGKLIGEFGKERRIPISFEDTPDLLVKAVLAVEDDSFFEHPGIDIKGVARAFLANITSGQKLQGASTITMQVARNYFLTAERTYSRKLNELILALSLERNYSKQQILELYLNKIFLGHRAYGFAGAAQVYYGKALEELNLAQIGLLAGLPKAPSQSNPLTNPQRAKKRRNYVLSRMLELKFISQSEYKQAVDSQLSATKHAAKIEFEAPYMAEMVRQHLYDLHGEDIYGSGFKVYTTIESDLQSAADESLREGLILYDRRHGYRLPNEDEKAIPGKAYGHLQPAVVTAVNNNSADVLLKSGEQTTLSWEQLKWSKIRSKKSVKKPSKASHIVASGQNIYLEPNEDNWRLAQIPKIAGAIVTLDPVNGAIKALSGGFDFQLSKFNRATQARRQAGSNIKPFIYSAALDRDYTASSKISADPLVIKDISVEAGIWKPGNYSGKFYGYTTLRKALSKSINLVSVRLLNSIGIEFGINHLSKFNFNPDRLPRGLSLALGSADVTPLEMAASYAVFANGGYRIEPYFIDRVEDRDGTIIAHSAIRSVCHYCPVELNNNTTQYTITSLSLQQPAERVISAANAYVITDMLKQVIRSGTASSAKKLGRSDLGGKTGTTNNFKDAWFSGFNQNLVTSVWVGFDQPRTLGKRESATRVALPIWIDFMETALKDSPETMITKPDNVRHKDQEYYIISNRPERIDNTLILDTIQKQTEEKAEVLF